MLIISTCLCFSNIFPFIVPLLPLNTPGRAHSSVLITIQQTMDPGLPAGAGNRDNGGYKLCKM